MQHNLTAPSTLLSTSTSNLNPTAPGASRGFGRSSRRFSRTLVSQPQTRVRGYTGNHAWTFGIFFFILTVSFLSNRTSASDDVANNALAVATKLYQSNQWQPAAAAFDQLAQDEQQDATVRLTAQLYAGECLIQLKDYAAARLRFQRIQKQNPPAKLAAQALFRLGEVAWLANDGDEAAQLLQSYLDSYPQGASKSYVEDYLEQIRKRQATLAKFAVLDEAVGLERNGQHDAALAAYRNLLDSMPHNTQPSNTQPHSTQVRAEVLRRTAQLHDRLAQANEAISLYQQFLTENPNSKHTAEVMLAIAWLSDRPDQPTQASDQFRAIYTKFPQSPQAEEAAYWLARQNADKDQSTDKDQIVDKDQIKDQITDEKKSSQAVELTDWLLARAGLSTRHPQLWGKTLCLKCQLLSQQNQWQQIDTLVDTFVEAARGRLDANPLETKLEFWAAEAAFRLRKYGSARSRYKALQQKVIGMNEPWVAMVPLRRAQLAARRQQWLEVLKILDKLQQDYPQFELNYEVDYLRGRAHAGRGQMTTARKWYHRVLENQQATQTEAATMASWMIGETFFHQNDYARARAAYETVMERATLSEWKSRAALQAGKCWELEQHWGKAAQVYSAALERWPHSTSEQELASRLRWAERNSPQIR